MYKYAPNTLNYTHVHTHTNTCTHLSESQRELRRLELSQEAVILSVDWARTYLTNSHSAMCIK